MNSSLVKDELFSLTITRESPRIANTDWRVSMLLHGERVFIY